MDDRFNTAAGWVLFAGIIALGLSVLSGKYFHGDKAERPEQLGYVIEGAETEDDGAGAGPDLGTLLASATAEAGEKVFAKCSACHTIEQGGANGIGPNLWAVMGTEVGKHMAGYAYSPALSGHGGSWTWENMDAWLKNPRAFADGTKMSFAGLSSAEDRANLMVYMESMGGAPARPAPAVVEEAPAEDAAAEGEAAEGEAAEGEAAPADAAA
ncbi:cytochrome c family protein [Altererythrobacter sp. BO-6]|uniref:c-type cytochrome n=1 Tax=Altererythrobacter sp. BO-6 TaxID=2604537 RepID=UPI0013E1918A|nr:cytochrome c family protein [Altererythrobacter sp. BO-6]QIG53827.1 cytochrome c family protein [Altererythrobacter sp. BO-6]